MSEPVALAAPRLRLLGEWLGRMLVTAAGVALPTLLAQVVLPGAQGAALPDDAGFVAQQTSIVGNGLDGVLLAFVLVELAALSFPRWRRLRQGVGRVHLLRATFVVATMVVIAQAMFNAWALRGYGWALFEPGFGPLLIDAGALVAGTGLLLVGARAVSRWGSGHGLSVVAVLGALPGWLVRADAATTGDDAELLVRTLLFVTIATVALLGREVRGERLPVVGLLPLLVPAWAMQVVAFVGLVTTFDLGALGALGWMFRPTLWTVVTVVLLLTFLPALLRSRAARGATSSSQIRGILGLSLGRGSAVSGAIAVAIVLADQSLGFDLSFFAAGSGIAYFVVALACVMDVLREAALRSRVQLVPVLVLTDLAMVDRVGERLAREDISHVMRGVGHRTLLRFFGPWVPVKLLVDRERAEEATRLARTEANREAYAEITRFF